ncbi:hypothetical protein RAZWK3B_14534 [Roseobacter sp. AzwK-3b]|uniref:hypothetical protein n=1 Tax=Roseobacter sp. AzwK-3b TaxID=351016 RepID=UPI0001568C42|nr:hypothetical protein [Roseobacter sp. AzwK-3b]EDM71446.1 hypothetical protein RAZWK3B_14534 [Roseobacter sp. AzwK-3b]
MTDIQFDRLVDLPLRDAWKHEAHEFTPWLAQNIDHLSEAIGVPLELTGTEVAVETFSADILARNPMDDSIVLIENQLETTDHTHLGQIMTYLAGLEAQTVIWIAPAFREPHLSAIRWLNEHTADGFSFFAIKARVVRIGDSPFAPIFEVVEKPNDWERGIKQKATGEGAAYYDIKEKFWQDFTSRYPRQAEAGMRVWRYPSNYIELNTSPQIDLAVWIGRTESGIYLRSGWGEGAGPVSTLLAPHQERLETQLDAPLGPSGRGNHFLAKRLSQGHEAADWTPIMDWMNEQIESYRSALAPVLKASMT